MAALIVIAILALIFVGAVWAKSGQPENQGAALGHDSPWPQSVFPSPPGVGPVLGSPESLESEPGSPWTGNEETTRPEHQRAAPDG